MRATIPPVPPVPDRATRRVCRGLPMEDALRSRPAGPQRCQDPTFAPNPSIRFLQTDSIRRWSTVTRSPSQISSSGLIL